MNQRAELIAQIEHEAQATAELTGRSRFAPAVLNALRKVNRAAFVQKRDATRAYVNAPLGIGCGQTISQPFIVALMTELLELQPTSRVLEVGTGSGYQAAVLGELSSNICSIEVVPQLAARARQVLAAEGYTGIALRTGDGSEGWLERAPFDAIIVTAAAASVPPALVEQLAPGGRLVIPIGEPYGEQELKLLSKAQDGAVTTRRILPVAFVPLTKGSAD